MFILNLNYVFYPNIHQIETKIAQAAGILNKAQSLLAKVNLILLYCAFPHLHELFALPLRGSTFPSYLQKTIQTITSTK